MPDLPTFTVTTATAQRLMKSFEGQTDENGVALTPQQAYKRWLRQSLVSFVLAEENRIRRDALENDIGA